MKTEQVWKNTSVLVTGATGLIGSALVDSLVCIGANVTICGRNEEKIKLIFKKEISENRIKYIVTNVSSGLPEIDDDFDFIFHAASPISGAEIKLNPVDTIEANLSGCRSCLEYLRKQQLKKGKKGRLIVFSSATVYGNHFSEDYIASEEKTNDTDTLDSDNAPYSESKRMIEVLSRAYYKQYEVDSVIVRIGYVYGYSKSMPNTAFYEFIKKAINGEKITLNNSGMGRRDNIYVEDVVDGLMTVAVHGVSGEAYNISSGNDMGNFSAIDEIADVIAKCAYELNINEHSSAEVKPMTEPRKPGLILDNSKIKELGWCVKTELKEGIMSTIKLYIND
ncbi:MAG: NAD(P)-dependent oxidoreductase [Lachnospiraceae bacterium]|nr:NAD(P)-dependent oxidoreductase [Lachnospiraceae bacterium]